MKKNPLIIGLATLAVIIFGIFFLSKSQKNTPLPTSQPNIYEYFWGDGCPHCAKVEEFMSTWDKKDKVSVTKYEVWKDKNNLSIFTDRAAKCGIGQRELAVPMLVTPEGKCLMGDQPIIDLFKSL